MKIAINCAFFQPRGGGIKEYVQNLVENLSLIVPADYKIILYVLEDYYDFALSHLCTNYEIRKIPFKGSGLVNTVIRSMFESLFWRHEEKREKWDLFHSPFFHAPQLRRTKIVLTVHDLRFFRYPETYTFLRYAFLKHAVKSAVKRAKKIISISQFTKEELVNAYGVAEEKIQVIHEAINPIHFSLSDELSEEEQEIVKELSGKNFLLSVGHLEPRKNLNRLIEALELLNRCESEKVRLVIVGKLGHNYEDTLSLINNNSHVIYLNFVSQNILNWLYSNAALFVFPTFYEGFGFPPLEAAMHGTISAVSNTSSIPEVCGDAALYFDPFNVKDMVEKIREGIKNEKLRDELKSKLHIQLSKFSWERNAIETFNLYQSLIGQEVI